MVYVILNSRDFKAVMAVADIDAPSDIVSHRIGCALIEFDHKYSSCQNGAIEEADEVFRNVVSSVFFLAALFIAAKHNNLFSGGCFRT